MERPSRAAFVGAAVAALITLPGLGVGTLWDNSETAYGEVAREILITHDWVVMHFKDVPYFVQPPLYFWVAAFFALFFGATAFALRLPAALATIAMGAMTGYGVARQAGTRAGIYASVILSTCLMQVIIGRMAIMDALLDLAVAMTIFFWFRGLETGRDPYFVYGWIAAAFGFLAKGLVAPVVALLVIVPFFFWNRANEPTHLPSPRAWLISMLAFFAIALPWPIALVTQYHGLPLEKLVGQYTIGRYTGVIENQSGPVWYYIPVIILGFFPWVAFLPMAVVYGMRSLRPSTPLGVNSNGDAKVARLVRLSFTWIVVPFIFFSFARTKLPNYVALELPALALLIALYFEAVTRRGGTRSAVISASFVPLTIGALAFAVAVFATNNRLDANISQVVPGLIGLDAAIFIGSLLTALLLARSKTVGVAPYALAVAMLVAMDVLAMAVLPLTEAYKPIPRLAAIIQRERKPGDVVALQNIAGSNALVFYTQPDVVQLAPPDDGTESEGLNPRTVICAAPRTWVVAPTARPVFDPTYGRRRSVVAVDRKAALYLFDGPPCK